MGWMPKDNKPIKLNGVFHTNSAIMRFVVASAAEAELGALFHNCQTGIFFLQTLNNLGHHHPKYPSTAIMQQQSASQMIWLRTNNQDLWK
jgi:hypothetical protein